MTTVSVWIVILVFFSTQIGGTITTKNAGGNPTYPSFMNNPQYRLVLHKHTTLPNRLSTHHDDCFNDESSIAMHDRLHFHEE